MGYRPQSAPWLDRHSAFPCPHRFVGSRRLKASQFDFVGVEPVQRIRRSSPARMPQAATIPLATAGGNWIGTCRAQSHRNASPLRSTRPCMRLRPMPWIQSFSLSTLRNTRARCAAVGRHLRHERHAVERAVCHRGFAGFRRGVGPRRSSPGQNPRRASTRARHAAPRTMKVDVASRGEDCA